MIFGGGKPVKLEPPIPVNREEINAKLDGYYPAELRERGVGGAVLVRVAIDERGRVGRVRALKPRIAGFIPRPRPRVFHPATGKLVKGLEWTGHPELMRAATRAVEHMRFIPGARDGIPTRTRRYSVVCVFVPDIVFRQDPEAAPTGVLTGNQVAYFDR